MLVLLLILLPRLISSSPHGFFINRGMSLGPGRGGAPMLVDTSAHMGFGSPIRGRAVSLSSSKLNQVGELPVIRPATNVPGQDIRRVPSKGNMEEEETLLNTFISNLYNLWLKPTVKAEPIGAIIPTRSSHSKPRININIETEKTKPVAQQAPPNFSIFIRPQAAPKAKKLPEYIQRLNMASLPVIRAATNVPGGEQSIEDLPVIRPATNV